MGMGVGMGIVRRAVGSGMIMGSAEEDRMGTFADVEGVVAGAFV